MDVFRFMWRDLRLAHVFVGHVFTSRKLRLRVGNAE
jgi:hypothetical protein